MRSAPYPACRILIFEVILIFFWSQEHHHLSQKASTSLPHCQHEAYLHPIAGNEDHDAVPNKGATAPVGTGAFVCFRLFHFHQNVEDEHG